MEKLARIAGTAQRVAMKLLRHSDIKLTAKVYTDETQLPIYEAIKGLPRLLDQNKYAHRFRAQGGKTWRKLSRPAKGRDTQKAL